MFRNCLAVRQQTCRFENQSLLAIGVQVGIEGSDNVYTLLALALLGDLELTRVIEDSSDRHWLHRPLLLELVEVALALAPHELSLIGRRDINRSTREEACSALTLVSLLLAATALILSCLVQED